MPTQTTVKKRNYPELKRGTTVEAVRSITIFGSPKRFVPEGSKGVVTETSNSGYVSVKWTNIGGTISSVHRDALKLI